MKKRIITISREYGSGGSVIAQNIGKQLDIPVYDDEINTLIAEESGFKVEFVREWVEHMKAGQDIKFLDIGAFYPRNLANGDVSVNDEMFYALNGVINRLAENATCIIVGRCSDYILQDREDVVNVFIYADYSFREERAIVNYGIDPDHVHNEIKKQDKFRSRYYGYYCDRPWGEKGNYHAMLDSGKLGIEKTAEVIINAFL